MRFYSKEEPACEAAEQPVTATLSRARKPRSQDVIPSILTVGIEPMFDSFGLLPTNLPALANDARFDDVATPPMRALRNLTRVFADSVPMTRTYPVSVEAVALGPQTAVFEGDASHPPLWHREVLAVLPFQSTPSKHVFAVYVMTRDATKPFAPAPFRLTLKGLKGSRVTIRDPVEDRAISADVGPVSGDTVTLTMPVAAHPRLIVVE